MTKDPDRPNQGEGDADADGRYRDAARLFVEAGRVPAAAIAARAANDDSAPAPPRAAGDQDDPLPSFWTPRQESGWARVKEALHRDWLQTKRDLGLGGAELGQSAAQTVEQAAGVAPMPNGAEPGLGWDLARHAIRLGHGAATFWVADVVWSEDIEARVRAEWSALGSGVAWEQALPLIRHGWELGRRDMASSAS